MGDEGEHHSVITGKPCARQEDIADGDNEVAGFVNDSSEDETKQDSESKNNFSSIASFSQHHNQSL